MMGGTVAELVALVISLTVRGDFWNPSGAFNKRVRSGRSGAWTSAIGGEKRAWRNQRSSVLNAWPHCCIALKEIEVGLRNSLCLGKGWSEVVEPSIPPVIGFVWFAATKHTIYLLTGDWGIITATRFWNCWKSREFQNSQKIHPWCVNLCKI